DRGLTRLLDQRNVEITLLVALDFCLAERRKSGRFQESLDRGLSPADARAAAFFLQIGLARGDAVHGQRQPSRRRERFRALVNQPSATRLSVTMRRRSSAAFAL